jgi:hypothetical protein
MDGVYYCKIGTGVGTGYSSTISTLTNVNIPTAIRTSSFASFDGTTITFNNTGYYSVNLQLNLVSLNGTSTYINLSSTTGANVTAYSACSGGVNNLAVTGQSSVIYTTWLIKVNNASSGNTCYFTMIPQGGGPGVREIWYQTGQYGFISIVYTDTL